MKILFQMVHPAKYNFHRVPINNLLKKGHEVEVLGPSKIVYRPDKPMSCGERVWIETEAEVNIA